MLLGGFAFPIALKRVLKGLGAYEWSDDDQDALDLFEHLVCKDLFSPPKQEQADYPWQRIRKEFRRQQRVARAAAALRALSGEEKPD